MKKKLIWPGPKRRATSIVVFPLIAAIVLFAGPAAGFALGYRATPIDNRPLADFPSLSDGWSFFPKFQAWADDHLPYRSQAVKAGTNLSEGLFGEPARFSSGGVTVAGVGGSNTTTTTTEKPTDANGDGVKYPQVIAGKNDWLYFGSDFEPACKPEESMSTIMQGFQTLSDAASQSGRKIVIVIAPDKSSAHPENLPSNYAGKACAAKQKASFWAAAAKLKGIQLTDPKPALAQLEKSTGRSVWRKYDTHWAPEGAAAFATLVASELEPSLLNSTTVVPGKQVQAEGDLTALLGDPKSESVTSVAVDRPGVTLHSAGKDVAFNKTPDLGYSPITVTGTSTGAELYQPKTLLLGDSFFEASQSEILPFFRSISYVHNMSGDIPGANATLAVQVKDTDTIVYELVERAAVGGYVSYQHPKNFEALASAMLKYPRN